jgi:5-methylcytosine-specific restriction endonuclease McrA
MKDAVETEVLDLPVLVLNRNWQPVHTCPVRRALHLLCLGHAQVVQVEGEERFATHDLAAWARQEPAAGAPAIHGVRMTLAVPKVIVLAGYDRLPRLEVRFSRRNVFLRDQFTCQYCSRTLPEAQLNLDHVHPRDKGGRTSWDNIVTSCFRCNTRKANKLPHEANMHPVRPPVAPRWRPLYSTRAGAGHEECWAPFLGNQSDGARRSA